MSTIRRFRPQVEPLEGRALLSTLHLSAAPVSEVVSTQHHTLHVQLQGTVTGIFTVLPGLPDTGVSQSLTGNGTVAPLGHLNLTGSLHLTGMLAHGHATGTLTLNFGTDSLIVRLTGPAQPSFGGAPSFLYFSIAGGSGVYRRAVGYGKVTLTELPGHIPNCPPGQVCPMIAYPPQFTLTFHPRPMPVGLP